LATVAASTDVRDVRDRLLDAAESCFDRFGTSKTTMEDVASAAGVSRGFVYKHLKNKDGLILAVLVRRAEQFNARARRFIESQPTLADALVHGIVLAARLAHRDPYFGLLVGAATTDPANRIPGAAEEGYRLTAELWRPVLEAARDRGELRPDLDIDDVVHWVMYCELILLAGSVAFGVDDATHERHLRQFLVPSLLRRP
jgi:AcrR family transcriptional regulator